MGELPACVLVAGGGLVPAEGVAGGAGVEEALGPAYAWGGPVWQEDLGQGSPPCPSCLHCADVPVEWTGEKALVYSNQRKLAYTLMRYDN